MLEPLGMEGEPLSTMDTTAIAMPHAIVPGAGWRRIALGKADANLHAAGGHFATPRDLARFVASHASGGILDGARVFPEAPIVSTHETHATQDREFGPFRRLLGIRLGPRHLGGPDDRPPLRLVRGLPLAHVVRAADRDRGRRARERRRPVARLDSVATYIYDRVLRSADTIGGLEFEAEYERRWPSSSCARDGRARDRGRARHAPIPSGSAVSPSRGFAGTYVSPRLGTMTWRILDDGLEVEMGVARSQAEVFNAEKDELRWS
jgi:hypothetical protein